MPECATAPNLATPAEVEIDPGESSRRENTPDVGADIRNAMVGAMRGRRPQTFRRHLRAESATFVATVM